MADYTPQQYAKRLRAWSRGTGAASLRGAIEKAAREGSDIIAGTSIGQYMRDAGAGAGPRSATDRGPLRIVTGTLAKAMRAPDGTQGGISRITATGSGDSLRVTLEKGVSLSVVPYAHVHEKGISYSRLRDRAEINIPARPYIRPAVDASLSRIAKRAQAIVRGSFLSHVGGR